MDSFGTNSALGLIILDLKVFEVDLVDFLVTHIITKTNTLGVTSKLKIVSSDYRLKAFVHLFISIKRILPQTHT